jgi:hypothetical protein
MVTRVLHRLQSRAAGMREIASYDAEIFRRLSVRQGAL